MVHLLDLPTDILLLFMAYEPTLGHVCKRLYIIQDDYSKHQAVAFYGEPRSLVLYKHLKKFLESHNTPEFLCNHCWTSLNCLCKHRWAIYDPERTATVDDEIIPITKEGSVEQNVGRWNYVYGNDHNATTTDAAAASSSSWWYSVYVANVFKLLLRSRFYVEPGHRYRLLLCYKSLDPLDNVHCRVDITFGKSKLRFYPFKQLYKKLGDPKIIKGKDVLVTLGYFNVPHAVDQSSLSSIQAPEALVQVTTEAICDFFIPTHRQTWYRYWCLERMGPVAEPVAIAGEENHKKETDMDSPEVVDMSMSDQEFQLKYIDKPPTQLSESFRTAYNYILDNAYNEWIPEDAHMVETFVNYG